MRIPRAFLTALLAVWLLTGGAEPALGAALQEGVTLTLAQALSLAESRNPGLQLTALQLANSRAGLSPGPTSPTVLAPAISAFVQAQYGITVPEEALPQATTEQSKLNYEQAAAQYYTARQQVRSGMLRAYVEWQRAVAMVASQQAALDRTLTQEANVTAALAVGSAAQYDLLQVQAAVAGQRAGLVGAQAMESAARSSLGQVIGTPIAPAVQPEPNTIRAAEITLPANPDELVARAMINRPDLRRSALDLAARRLQAEVAMGGNGTLPQLQATATQYELTALEARTKVTQAWLAAQGALEELKAREIALEPSREALRLAELRYDAGIATWVEVQTASAAALESEVNRIQSASNLLVRLLELHQATGDL